jgi:hypothetical protein
MFIDSAQLARVDALVDTYPRDAGRVRVTRSDVIRDLIERGLVVVEARPEQRKRGAK